MAGPTLEQAIHGIPSLRGVFITAMPDCLLFDSWIRPSETWHSEEASAYFGDLVRANREALERLGAWSPDMQVTIESADVLLVFRQLRDDFVVTFAFDHKAPLGMVRLQTKRALAALEELLPRVGVEARPRAVRVKEFLLRYAPDPHAVLQRVSLRTKLALEDLQSPENLDSDQCDRFERCVKEILGIDTLNL